jgi:hypothetical protein
MDDPIQWGAANLSWTPDGYRLELPVWLDVRGSAVFEQRLPDLLESFEALKDGPLSFEFTGGRRWSNETGAGADPASLTVIAHRTLFAVAPEELHRVLGTAAAESQREADEQHARDQEAATAWLATLRGNPAS